MEAGIEDADNSRGGGGNLDEGTQRVEKVHELAIQNDQRLGPRVALLTCSLYFEEESRKVIRTALEGVVQRGSAAAF